MSKGTKIIDGPDRFGLATSLFSGGGEGRQAVDFLLEGSPEIWSHFNIDEISRGEMPSCFNFKAHHWRDTDRLVQGFYDVETRSGWIEDVPKEGG